MTWNEKLILIRSCQPGCTNEAQLKENAMSDQTIPTIDMAKLHEPDMRARLDRACRDWGFFQLINHGVEPMMTDALLTGPHHWPSPAASHKL